MTPVAVRQPAFAGRFYPRDAEALRQDIGRYLTEPGQKKRIRTLGCIAPHAGYMYSGHIAGAVFGAQEIPELGLVLCPNHTGIGQPFAIMSEGSWKTPLGNVAIDSEFAAALKQRCSLLVEDSSAHQTEHAVEVELPFLQYRQPTVRLVPIALGTSQFEALEELGNAVADAIAAQANPVLIIASSDMNHYESDAITRAKDQIAIKAMLHLDPRALYDAVTQHQISMCGFGPAVAMLTATKKLGATGAELVKYATSGDVSGDHDLVVGYAGIIVPAVQLSAT